MAALLCALVSSLRHFFKHKEEVEEKEALKTEEHEIEETAKKENWVAFLGHGAMGPVHLSFN